MTLKSPEEIKHMREGGRILARILRAAGALAVPGATGKEIDKFIESEMRKAKVRPAFLGYHPEGARVPYPAASCISTNEVIVHGLPSADLFREGDVVKIDTGLIYKDLYLDSAITVGVGRVSKSVRKLIQTTRAALEAGIAKARIGNTIGDIGFTINSYIAKHGFVIVKNLTGHGVGHDLHEEPTVYNFGRAGYGLPLQEGLVIAIEPMASVSSSEAVAQRDDSFVTHDGSLSAQWEHTVAITKDGPLILTQE
jgi:methionyl aminopeptidase